MTITADANTALFPVTPNYSYLVSPRFLTDIVKREGGYERLNAKWSRPLLFISAAPFEDTPIIQMEQIRDFYYAMRGEATYFRFKDWSDYKSVGLGSTTGFLDQPLTELVDAAGTYQLIKEYSVGSITQVREIYKPVGSTIRIANESNAEQDSADWTLDEATGVLTPGGGFTGTPTYWGGDFDVEVRFSGELHIEYSNAGTMSSRVSMQERRRSPTT
jgi:uncharacterized protein (TIGR02217 family)